MQVIPAQRPGQHARVVGKDDDFSIVAQDFGPGGHSIGAILIEDRKTGRWMELVQVSTKDSVLGFLSPQTASDPERPISVTWDYRPLATEPVLELPLHTSGSINLPSSAVVDGPWIRLRFNEGDMPPSALTALAISRVELLGAIATCPRVMAMKDEDSSRALVLVELVRGDRAAEKSQEERSRLQAGHMANMRRLAEERVLLTAGPFGKDNHDPSVRGIFILDVATLRQARTLSESDPAVAARVLAMRLHRFRSATDLKAVLEADLEAEAEARREGRELRMEDRIRS